MGRGQLNHKQKSGVVVNGGAESRKIAIISYQKKSFFLLFYLCNIEIKIIFFANIVF